MFSHHFISTGCLISPLPFTCFGENVLWGKDVETMKGLAVWLEQWAKAGANPNFRVENPEIYIKNFNWVSNWFNEYFFNKVSDFLLGLFVLCLIVFLLFFSKKNKKFEKPKYLLVYSIIIFLTLEWFYLLPTLRYGGYHLIAMIFFISSRK